MVGVARTGRAVEHLLSGPVEQMRVLLVARRSARQQRIQTPDQLRHLAFTAPEEIRASTSSLTR